MGRARRRVRHNARKRAIVSRRLAARQTDTHAHRRWRARARPVDNSEDEARMMAGREDRDWLATLIAVQEGRFRIPLLDDAGIRDLLRSNPRIAMVGASSNPGRPSHGVLLSLR